jgi:P27 family predicted phage terminase small subunit
MKGRKPTVGNVVPMRGDPKKRVPDAPDFMTDNGRKVWESLAAQMVAKDRLDPLHEHMFAAYCESVSNFIDATHCLAMEGLYYETQTRNGKQQKKTAPWGLQQEAMAKMQQLGALFGMSPVDEKRLGAGGQGDLFDEVLKKINGTG